jgi:hypothetical protein
MRELTSESDVSADSFRTAWFRLRTTSVTETGEAVYPDGGYTASLRLHMQSGATNIGVNGYPLWVDNR